MEIIRAKYPKAVFTGESAFYYHGLMDVIPDFYHLATVRMDRRIKDEQVKQTFLKEHIFHMGQIKIEYNKFNRTQHASLRCGPCWVILFPISAKTK